MLDFNILEDFRLHNHTESSNQRLLDSTNKLDLMVNYGRELGLKGINISDHDTLTKHEEGMEIGQKLIDEGSDFKVSLGNEIYLVNSVEEVRDNYQGGGETKFPHFVLCALNKTGHEALRLLSTEAWKNSFRTGKMTRVPTTKESFARILMNPKYKDCVVGSTACLGSEVAIEWRNYMNGDSSAMARLDKFVGACQTVLGKNNFYLEIQPGDNEEQIQYNMFILMYGKTKGIKVIFTTDTHYLKKEHSVIHSALLNSKDGDREVASFYSSTYMMSTEEVWDYLKDYVSEEEFVQMCSNSMEIYDRIEYYNLFKDTVVPQINIPPFNNVCRLGQEGSAYDYISKYYNSDHLIDKYLVFMLDQGIRKLGQDYNETNIARLNEELGYIWEISERLGSRLASYYLLTQEVIDLCWLESYVGIARGSATGMFICYLLQITQMNPLQYDLPAWRHIHDTRPELPDIDFDLQPEKREHIFEMMKEKYGRDKVLNIVTIKTLSPKACIQTVGRGLEYNGDDIMSISDMIPIERGASWTITECLEGNEEKERKPIPQFKKAMKDYPNLIEYALELEGLQTGISSHASGLFTFASPYTDCNSLMVTPGGIHVTCWTMNPSEKCGALKLDFLVTEAMSKLRSTMDILIEKKKVVAENTLRDTYNKYLHPDILDYTSEGMYDLIFSGDLIDAFQFQTSLGKQVLKKLNARSFMELTVGNSLMRLVAKHGEQPLDRYVRYKNKPGLWEYEMKSIYKLTEEEIVVMKDNLDICKGVMDTQELLMMICMDSRVSNFTMKEANLIRKAIAKKKAKMIEESKKLFYTKGEANGCRIEFLDYIWNEQITPQLGYSFSLNHTTPYSGIMIQEANLAYKYGAIYWKCGVLRVNSQSETDKTVDYGKIATAVGELRDCVEPPNINLSQRGFTVEDDKIIYGLKPILKVSDTEIEQIVANRPYTSFEDFRSKCEVGNLSILNLIKSGCFDTLEPNREKLLFDFVLSITETKNKLTMSNINDLVEHQIVEKSEFEQQLLFISVYKYVCSKPNLVEIEDLKGQWYKVDSNIECQFLDLYNELEMDRDYFCNELGLVVKKSSVEKVRKANTKELVETLAKEETLQLLNDKIIEASMNKLAMGERPKWEMDSMYYYYSGHELDIIDNSKYNIVDFNTLGDTPEITDQGITKKGFPWRKFRTHLVAGTVLDYNKTNHFIVIQTPSGVVPVRMNKGSFDWYNKNVSETLPNGKKKVVDTGWFKRGTRLIIQGYRNENGEFIPKKYSDSILQHTCIKIINIKDNDIEVQLERATVD